MKIFVSYLSNRTMVLTYKRETSSVKQLPAGTPQGAFLGVLIFIIKFNGAFLRPSIPRPALLQNEASEKVKYIDDGTVAVSVNLSRSLVPDPVARLQPLAYHERLCQVLPNENNLLQYYIRDTEEFASRNNMRLNEKKTKVILFNFSRKHDFPPEVFFSDGTMLECISEISLLGVTISENLKWTRNTTTMCTKARQRLWIIRRLQLVDLSVHELYDVYIKEIRAILEYAVPVWHSGITRKEAVEIEAVQKLAFKIILRKDYSSYSLACSFFNTHSLEQRRLAICTKFANKNLKSSNSFFTPYTSFPGLRQRNKLVEEFRCNSLRF